MSAEEWKRQAALAALDAVEPGMRLGIGTGSTAEAFVRVLADRVRQGLSVIGVATSERTARLAEAEGIAMTSLDKEPELDLTIDGADEIGPDLALIKGGGGALLREKIVASASRRMLVVADAGKKVQILGRFPLPIEIVRFGREATERAVTALARKLGLSGPIALRTSGGLPYVTDEGHYILDASFGRIPDPEALAASLNAVPGVVEHGLFIGIATEAIVAGPGGVERLTRLTSP
ncbi:MAG: ribose-5-phosphate isomerase RpiA [Sphingomonadales bacterium]